MKERTLLAISLGVALIGMAVVWCARPEVSPEFFELEGRVERVDTRGDVSFVRFSTDDLHVVAFETDIEEGNQVLIGRLQPYKGRIEFVVHSLKKAGLEDDVREDEVQDDRDDAQHEYDANG